MSYAIVRVQKFSAGSVGGIQIHDKRLKDGTSHTNQDIDWERSHLNYDLARAEEKQTENKNFYKAIKERIESLNLKKAVRKDAVVMAQCLVTSDKDFFDNLTPTQTKEFFEDSYEWLCARYGKENVISATVHMDERTPHMHFNFVPVTPDGRLSAKSVLTRQSLIEQQDLFVYDVGENYGLQRGQEGGKKVHLEVAEYKLETKKSKLEHTEKLLDSKINQLESINDELYKNKRKFSELEESIIELEGKKTSLEREIDLVEYRILNTQEISAIKPKKGLGGGLRDITMEDVTNLKQMSMDYVFIKKELEYLKIEYSKVSKKAIQSLDTFATVASLKNENHQLEKKIKSMEKVVESNPELKKLYQITLEAIKIASPVKIPTKGLSR